jgi:hypothetical protein
VSQDLKATVSPLATELAVVDAQLSATVSGPFQIGVALGDFPQVHSVLEPTIVPATLHLGPPGPKGDDGAAGADAPVYQHRSDFLGNVNYLGKAPLSTLESAAAWLIYRLTFNSDGSLSEKATANAVAWTNRTTVTYS